MMPTYAVFDETGVYPLYLTNQAKPPEGGVEIGDILPERIADMMWLDGQFVPRPRIGDPNVFEEDGILTVEYQAPDDTTATVVDLFTGEKLGEVLSVDGKVTIEFQDQGGYQIELTPPLPYLRKQTRVEFNADQA